MIEESKMGPVQSIGPVSQVFFATVAADPGHIADETGTSDSPCYPFQPPPAFIPSNRYRALFNELSVDRGSKARWALGQSWPEGAQRSEIKEIMASLEQIRLEKVTEAYTGNDRIPYRAPLERLNASERAAVVIFNQEIAPLIDEIYSLQEDPKNLEYSEWMDQHGDTYSRKLFERHRKDTGIGYLLEDRFSSLFPFFPDPPPINGMIAPEISLSEFLDLVFRYDQSHPINAPDTLLFKDSKERVEWLPLAQSPLFSSRLARLAILLRKTANLSLGNAGLSESLKRQLCTWATAIELGRPEDYGRAVQATIDQSEGLLRVNIGPVEPLRNGSKFAFSLQVGIRDAALKQELSGYSPAWIALDARIRAKYDQRRSLLPSEQAIDPIHQAVTAGELRAFPVREVSGTSFPNREYPGVKGNLRFIHLEVLEEISRRIGRSLPQIIDDDLSAWDPSRFLQRFVANHESGHLVGPPDHHRTQQGESLRASFGHHYGGFEEAKADLAALVIFKILYDEGRMPFQEMVDHCRAYAGYQLSNRYRGKRMFSKVGNHDFGRLLQVGIMFEDTAFWLAKKRGDPSGIKVGIDYLRMLDCAEKNFQKLIELQLSGRLDKAMTFAQGAVKSIPDDADALIIESNRDVRHFFIERHL